MIFNSLGLNYSLRFALKFLRARTSINADERLKEFLNQKYSGQTWLYYKGRSALSEAVRLCQADEVLTSGFSCYAVEQAIKDAGSQPVFTDIDTKTLNFSLKHLKDTHRANPRIKTVILKNTFGIGIDISQIVNYCRHHKLYIIEDLAHCPSNQYADGTNFGKIGDLVVLSFGRDKQIDAVNGGALPSYRSEFILGQFQNIEEDCRRRRRLTGIYDVLQWDCRRTTAAALSDSALFKKGQGINA